MSYRILLNKTRKEAFLISDGSENEEEEEYEMTNITKVNKSYTAIFSSLNWTFEDDIVLWETNTICYHTLQEYHELNFITYNKEAHFT
jgi:hypothetical protein